MGVFKKRNFKHKIVKMYALKPILTDQQIELPTSMYKMRPINVWSGDSTQESKNSNVSAFLSEKMWTFFFKHDFF